MQYGGVVRAIDEPDDSRRLVGVAAAGALLVGALAALIVASLDYALAYNDARARLVVARRILDSLTPGLQQMGAIWLPLPHLLNLPLVQYDWFYRTGAGTVALNVAAFAVLVGASVRIAARLTGRAAAAILAGAAIVTHPDVLYLQATPMTEPLALALLAGGVALLLAPSHGRGSRGWLGATLLGMAMLTRYETWPAAAGVIAVAAWAQNGARRRADAAGCRPLAATIVVAAAAVGVAAIWSRAVMGEWLVTAGFFAPTSTRHDLLASLAAVAGLAAGAAGPGLLLLALVGLAALVGRARREPEARIHLLAAVPLAALLVFWQAAYAGHPVLYRFMVFVVVPIAWLAAAGAAALYDTRRMRLLAALLVAAVAWHTWLWTAPPVINEALRDLRAGQGRTAVIAALAEADQDDRVLASMWSAAHVLHELSGIDLPLRRVIHESTGTAWLQAVTRPADHADWILVDCGSGTTDRVFRALSTLPQALAAYDVAARGAGLELYRLRPSRRSGAPSRLCGAR